ncbi:amidohydrolase family protein [Alkalibacillus haloalkaliphilus]|uniref:amidohydrolase family protein n=1 Tax=Alkalibacillus haloalkaliphilus TaxID=94136 RepID=UPI002935BC81|nr:amidohydrolase family protein [Alkalibacillus haloalkaliphilus]MDV2582039.1 amidohydrolase family protein [Alkalibacillus haloalkaliphilus]
MILKNVTFLNKNMKFETRDIEITDGEISFNTNSHSNNMMDCEDYIVIPGLINGHFHSYSSLAKGLMKEMSLPDWCNDSEQGKVQQAFFDYLDEVLSEEDFVHIAQKSYLDMIKHGVTFVSDSDPGEAPHLLKDAMNELGIRGMIDVYEDIGDYVQRTDNNISFGSHLLEEEDLTNEELLKAKEIKAQYNPIMMTHCLENEWRSNLVQSNFGKSSINLYDEHNLLDEKTVLFHTVYASNEDLDVVSQKESSIVHCPLSNLDTGAGVANVNKMLEKNINVCLGTDFAHTNMWDLMKLTYYLLKINQPVNNYAAEDIFKMATENGAKAYGLHEEIGQIQEGYKADLVFIKKSSQIAPLINEDYFSTYLHNLLFSEQADLVQHVMVNGKWVLKDRTVITVNEEEINESYSRIVNDFLNHLKNN